MRRLADAEAADVDPMLGFDPEHLRL